MTPQEVFNTVATHLFNQGKQAGEYREEEIRDGEYAPSFKCLYRGPEGTKCAAGFLIPDELYNPAMENRSIYDVIEAYPKLAELLEGNRGLLVELQNIHDGYSEKYNKDESFKWYLRRKLYELATDSGFTTEVLDSWVI
jgi:hypothetical protein